MIMNPKVKIRKVGYSRYHTIKMYIEDWLRTLRLKFYPPSRHWFADDKVKDGVHELLIERDPNEPLMKMVDGKWEKDKDDDGFESFWIVRH